MVLSGSARTTYMSSLINKNSGGGNKKAGIAPSVGRDSWMSVALGERGGGMLRLTNMRVNRFKRNANQNLPMGFNRGIKMY